MMPHPLVLLGGNEHALVVADAALSQPGKWRLAGFTQPATHAVAPGMMVEYLGDDESLLGRLAAMPVEDRPALVVGFGGNLAARRALAATFEGQAEWATIIHAAAWVSPSAIIEPGAVVLAGSVVNAGARVAAHAIINTHVVVEHDVVVGRFSHLAPGAVVGGGTRIGDETLVGLAAAVRDHVTIGDRVVVGMGAAVVSDVADDMTVVGVPARSLGVGRG